MIFAFAGWLWLSVPFFINPWAVISGLSSESIPDSTTFTMAALLPLVVLTCLFVLVAGVVFSFAAFSNEKKHIRIIRRLTASQCERAEKGFDPKM
ncbi:hypothetical protein ACFL4N_05180 [Thermodesulfobacteriota bacterium]